VSDLSESTKDEAPESNSKGSSPRGLLIFLLIFIVVGITGFALVKQNIFTPEKNNTNTTPLGQTAEEMDDTPIIAGPIAPYSLVYGTWSSEGSLIKSLDLSSGELQELAVLPIDIKKVSVLSPEKLLFIDQTDDKDHGKQLSFFTLKDNKKQVALKAADGFGIDDYVVSPNKKFVATWEVAIPEGASMLSQGKSRVYTASLDNPSQKNLVYDESAKTPVHYPLAILDNGKVFLDKFQANDPNGGTGWAYGMSVANVDGTGKQDLAQMANGTYGTQPQLSADGRSLAFAGYDGSLGAGTALKNGYRQAILTPNTVETLDATTLARTKIVQFPKQYTYSDVGWNINSNNIMAAAISNTTGESGDYIFNVASQTVKKATLPTNDTSGSQNLLAQLSADKFLLGKTDGSESNIANLGDTYGDSFQEFKVTNVKRSASEEINLPDQLMQKVAILPSNYFANVANDANKTKTSKVNTKNKSLQLQTFFVKTALGEMRTDLQSGAAATPGADTPRCRDLQDAQCDAQGLKLGTKEYAKCTKALGLKEHGSCHDSPLYLYGKNGQKVTVTVNTPVSSSIPSYTNGYNATLLGAGNFSISGKTYKKIEYDYISPLKKIVPPPYGKFVSRNEVEQTLTEYAKSLGLNEEETKDLVLVGKQKITSPYAFISFFGQNKSENILPLSFNPQPDNYLNVVFYFKLLNSKPDFSIDAPSFGPPIQRTGFTAVEVSEIVE
jgi:hypothetical protein